jgi:hypothetical protein
VHQVARALPAIVGLLLEALETARWSAGDASGCRYREGRRRPLEDRGDDAAWLALGTRMAVSISYSTAPNANTSLRASASLPCSCSAPCTGRPEDRAFRESARFVKIPSPSRTEGADLPRETEVEELRARLREHDVARFQVAVTTPCR